jgi:hypothetical protein
MKTLSLSVILASVLLTSSLSASSVNSSSDIKAVNKSTVNKEAQNSKILKKLLVKEALSSLKYTKLALSDLSKKDTKSATTNIQKALDELKIVLNAKNAPDFLPIDSQMSMNEYLGTKQEVDKTIKLVKSLLDDNKVQDARVILDTMKSEIDVKVVSLPLVTYPDALKLAKNYLKVNKIEKAKNVLSIALSTFDENTTIIPIPLVKASELIDMSQKLAKNGKKEEALKYINAAEDSLYIGEKLGYISKSNKSYSNLHESIQKIKTEINGKNKPEKLFSSLKQDIKSFKDKILSPKKTK